MIFIIVKSEIMDCKRQFDEDIKAERFLKRVKNVHDLTRLYRHIKQNFTPHETFTHMRYLSMRRFLNRPPYDMPVIPLKVTIQNTEAAQLNLINQLKK